MKGSLIILSFFATGLLLGVFRWLPPQLLSHDAGFYVLCALMFAVGVSIGHDPSSLRQFKNIQPRVLLLPFLTILGTGLGVLAVSFFIKNRSLTDCLAVGSGFGYYSLSSILITQCKGIELGTIALLANVMREILTLTLAPWMVKYFGKLAPISAGGATTMDTTLPIITRYSGQNYAIISVYHGIVVDFTVPFLVTMFCSL